MRDAVSEAPNPLLPGEPAMSAADATRLLRQESTSSLRKRLNSGSLRGVPPYGDANPTREWLVSRAQIEAEAVRKGFLPPPGTPPAAEPTLADMRAELLQGALSEEKDRRIAQLEAIVADKDAEIARLRGQLSAIGRAAEEQLVAAGRSLAAITAVPAP